MGTSPPFSRRFSTALKAAVFVTAAAAAFPAAAIDFTLPNGVTGSFDSTYTVGGAIRTKGRDPDLVGLVNGGRAFSANGDDGNLNFNAGDFTSLAARGVNELHLQSGDFQFFTRVNYFYDYINRTKTPQRTPLTDEAKHLAGLDFDLLDLYVSGKFDVGAPLTLRVGKQVLSWGESTFIQNGINIINPFDVTKLRTAGTELREGVIPVPMVQGSVSLSDTLSVEAFYQLGWDHTEIEAEGTFFSTNDFASPGGRAVLLGFGLPPPTGARDNPPSGANLVVPRAPDRDARDSGQYGAAVRLLVPDLNDAEFGAYFIRYNSRLPVVSAHTGTLAGAVAGDYAKSANYYREFPNDIKLAGLSINTTIGTVALQGEYSYHWDQPLVVDDVELLLSALSPLDPLLGLPAAALPIFGRSQLGSQTFNSDVAGYRRKDYSQAQFTLTNVFANALGMDQIALVGEVGAMWIHGMEDPAVLRYEGPGTYTSANPFFTTIGRQPATADPKGFADPFSWGYRLAARGEINNAIGSISLIPSLAFNHDVHGTSPSPIGNFVDGRVSTTFGLGANYLNNWQANLSYTVNMGGGNYNLLRDRDFVSLTVSYSF